MALDMQIVKKILDNDNFDMREKLKKVVSSDVFQPRYNISVAEERDLAYRRLKAITDSKLFSVKDFGTDPRSIFAAHEVVGIVDGSMAVKMTVQFNLFGGTVFKLGTETHRRVLDNIDTLQDVGCFGLTELGYGNNAVEMETTAEYDHRKKIFVINTPSVLAQKYWITNSVLNANWCVVFANLIVDGKKEGIHGFLTRIRETDGSISKGVRIEDMGVKFGCNGVDNGKLFFDHVVVPKTALLNAISDIDESGKFNSSVRSKRGRFLVVADQLLSGRICISSMCLTGTKVSLITAVKYSISRKAVGKSGRSDTPIFDYQLQQNAIVPLIADTYVLAVCLNLVKNKYAKVIKEDFKGENLILCCIIKPMVTWSTLESSNVCRERCGGQGYLSCNKISSVITFGHAGITAEGDNRVLMQKVTKELLAAFQRGEISTFNASRRLKFSAKSLAFFKALYQKRFQMLLLRLAMTIRRETVENKKNLFDVWMKEQSDLVQSVAISYGEMRAVETFLNLIEKLESEGSPKNIIEILKRILLLYSYKHIILDACFFATQKLLKPSDFAQIKQERIVQCRELAKHALFLVECFNIPDSLVGAPIVSDWTAYNEGDNKGEVSLEFLRSKL